MLYHLLFQGIYARTGLGVLNVTRYITFRTAAATLSALAISLFFGPWLVRKLREFQIGQVIRTEGPQTHRPKAGTPTMGGLLILTAANTYTGGTAINAGTLQISSDANLGAAAGGLSLNGGTLHTTADITTSRAVDTAYTMACASMR